MNRCRSDAPRSPLESCEADRRQPDHRWFVLADTESSSPGLGSALPLRARKTGSARKESRDSPTAPRDDELSLS